MAGLSALEDVYGDVDGIDPISDHFDADGNLLSSIYDEDGNLISCVYDENGDFIGEGDVEHTCSMCATSTSSAIQDTPSADSTHDTSEGSRRKVGTLLSHAYMVSMLSDRTKNYELTPGLFPQWDAATSAEQHDPPVPDGEDATPTAATDPPVDPLSSPPMMRNDCVSDPNRTKWGSFLYDNATDPETREALVQQYATENCPPKDLQVEPFVLLLSGPIGSGKSHTAKQIERAIAAIGGQYYHRCVLESFADSLKIEYSLEQTEHNKADAFAFHDRLVYDRAFKEFHRQGLIDLAAKQRAIDRDYFAKRTLVNINREIWSMHLRLKDQGSPPAEKPRILFVIDDWRYVDELYCLSRSAWFDPRHIIHARLCCSDNVLRARVPNWSKELRCVPSETALDVHFKSLAMSDIMLEKLSRTRLFAIETYSEKGVRHQQCVITNIVATIFLRLPGYEYLDMSDDETVTVTLTARKIAKIVKTKMVPISMFSLDPEKMETAPASKGSSESEKTEMVPQSTFLSESEMIRRIRQVNRKINELYTNMKRESRGHKSMDFEKGHGNEFRTRSIGGNDNNDDDDGAVPKDESTKEQACSSGPSCYEDFEYVD